MDLQLLSQCGRAYNFLSRPASQIHWSVAGALSNHHHQQQQQQQQQRNQRYCPSPHSLLHFASAVRLAQDNRSLFFHVTLSTGTCRSHYTFVSSCSSSPTFDPLLLTQCLLVGCLTSQQHASVSQGRICTDNFTCCHTEIEAADSNFPSHPVTLY